jgi:hypothetical protein
MRRPGTVFRILAVLVWLAGAPACRQGVERRPPLSDQDFRTLMSDLSEPAGVFDNAGNLVSNEPHFVNLIPMLRPVGGAYIGVGPEQNFSYMARLRPSVAFIIDIRRENRNLHLLYKALFELSGDREEFLSRLFSRARPPASDGERSIDDLLSYFREISPSEELGRATFQAAREFLVSGKGLALSADDLEWMERALDVFRTEGPDIHYWTSDQRPAGPSYAELMTAGDMFGLPRSYLATEDNFAVVKDLQARNRIVPIVGDFAGPDAMRRVGRYLLDQGQVVDAFYASNVEVYLNRNQRAAFCANLASLPYQSRSWFINNRRVQRFPAKLRVCMPRTR